MPKSYLVDMDGVIVSGKELIPGADAFIQRLQRRGSRFLILTNNSMFTPVDRQDRLKRLGIDLTPDHIYTSSLATASFLSQQRPNGTAFVLGETGLTEALHQVGYVLTEQQPDYVVLGETNSYSYARITRAVRLILQGARFIVTNPDPAGPEEGGVRPASGAIAALIQTAINIKPYFVGKPNPLMMRIALRVMDEHSENTVMVGDRMDTDVRVGIESGMETVLVLTGVTSRDMAELFPFRPTRIMNSVAELEGDRKAAFCE